MLHEVDFLAPFVEQHRRKSHAVRVRRRRLVFLLHPVALVHMLLVLRPRRVQNLAPLILVRGTGVVADSVGKEGE